MPEGVQIHSLTSNRLLYDRADAAGSPAIAADQCESADRTATWVSMVDQSSTANADRRNCIERLKRTARSYNSRFEVSEWAQIAIMLAGFIGILTIWR